MPSVTKHFILAVPFALLNCVLPSHGASETGVQLQKLADRVRVEVQGKLLTEYYFNNVPRPFCYPVLGPGESPMTRNWPMKDTANEEHDHPHHRSFWYAHGDVNGIDFWSETAGKFGKIVHEAFDAVESGKEIGVIKTSNNWIAPDGKRVCRDVRTLRFHNPGHKNEQIVDFEITLHASDGELVLGDTKEGTMAIRLAETMRLKGKVGSGHIVNSQGVRDGETWGKRAEWCDYYGPVNGKTVGIAIFDHPQNPRHPTWWHVRDYGLFAANPFGQHDFEKLSDKKAGNLVVPAGKSVTFKYRFLFHEGDEKQGQVSKHYENYRNAP